MRKVFLIIAIVVTLVSIYIFLIAPRIFSAEKNMVIIADGVEISIPAGALPASVDVSVKELPEEDAAEEMLSSEALASPIYNIEASTHSFEESIEIILEYNLALVSSDEFPIAAYWNGEIWVHVAGSVEGNTITVETDHFSFWVVLAAYRVYNELTDWVYGACTAFFAPEEDKWTVEHHNWLQIQGSLNTFLGELPEVNSIAVTDNSPLASIIVNGSTYSIVETNLPAYLSSSNYSQASNQLGVIDSRDRLVNDSEILFKALYAYRLREYLGSINLNAQADQLNESSSSLRTMHFWHGAISSTDIVQSLLSRILTHGSTSTAPSPAELLNPEILLAVEGIICRAEMERFADDMMSLSDDFRSCDPEQMSYEELSSLACRCEGTLYRIDALTAFMRGTCPGLEANWFVYTAKKVLSDYLSIFIQKEAAHLVSHTAIHSINFDNALYAAKLSTLYQLAGSSENIKGVFDLLVHAFNTNGSNPMVEYYNDIQRSTNELSSIDYPSFSILRECAYLTEMIDKFNFIKVGDVITDYQTDLQWVVGPNYLADSIPQGAWLNDLEGDWREPSGSEMRALYSAGIGYGNWGPFHDISGDVPIGQTTRPYGWHFSFYDGRCYSVIGPEHRFQDIAVRSH